MKRTWNYILLELPEVIPTEAEQEDEEEWNLMEEAIHEAIEHLIESRNEEGKALMKICDSGRKQSANLLKS
ncbi:MAG: YicC/YloC family endoribonuclease [Bacteroidia bacterium]